MTLYVNVYEMNRIYGGPEEGGWFYDAGTFIKCLGKFSDTDEEIANNLSGKFKGEKTAYRMGHGSHDGVDANGDADDRFLIRGGAWGFGKLEAIVEKQKGQNFPQKRPCYE